MSSLRLIAGSLAAAALLVGLYLALGGSGYQPTAVADPCAPRPWRSPQGVEQAAEQFSLSALDGAACELGVSRETLAVALASDEARARFAERYGIADAELEAAVRAGVVRAIDDAEAAGALDGLVADGLRAVAVRLPVPEAVALIEDASSVFDAGQGLLDRLGGLLGAAAIGADRAKLAASPRKAPLPSANRLSGPRSPARSTT